MKLLRGLRAPSKASVKTRQVPPFPLAKQKTAGTAEPAVLEVLACLFYSVHHNVITVMQTYLPAPPSPTTTKGAQKAGCASWASPLGGETGGRYRIRNGFQLNLELLDNKNRPVRVLCFMPEGDLVVGDMTLAQKLALELFESDTLKVANKLSPHDFSIGPMP
ncbi:MAG: hypothetical protein WBX25_03550 [Rhodomicrobium sp.]